MRRQDLQLLAAARQGDLPARLEVARRYLSGTDGFARHVQTGLDYLQHQGLRNHLPAMRTVVDNLSLHELIERGLLSTRVQAAELDHAAAQAKLAAWRLTRPGGWAVLAAAIGWRRVICSSFSRREPNARCVRSL